MDNNKIIYNNNQLISRLLTNNKIKHHQQLIRHQHIAPNLNLKFKHKLKPKYKLIHQSNKNNQLTKLQLGCKISKDINLKLNSHINHLFNNNQIINPNNIKHHPNHNQTSLVILQDILNLRQPHIHNLNHHIHNLKDKYQHSNFLIVIQDNMGIQ